ncbi:MAG TPA: exodeoxyribonuclease VII large subunit [Anaerolineae bacterium]|nr:exodeoxyribonuclease VII large subunit [Anaerolineae bacterium]
MPLWGGPRAGPSFSTRQIYRVSQITAYIKELFDSDYALQDLWLEGEVSNYTRAASGHVYFTLKDEETQIRCVMWRSQVERGAYLPQNGEAILAHGRISVYEAGGRYQLYVDDIQPAGAGLLYLQFEALKERLAAEGLFDAERKRTLPPFPRRLGVVTSPTAAALRDIVNVLKRRYPLVEVVLSPTLVQGDEAPSRIVAAIEALNQHADVDAIIVARGGGSLEELWAFNDERVARAIYASRVPVVTGVGHETDFTIADFVADVRAPTPSAAAELVVPDRQELRGAVESWRRRLAQLMEGRIEGERRALQYREQALRRFSPQAQIDSYRQRIDDLMHAALAGLKHRLALARERLRTLDSQLQTLSPLATLERGYAIARHLGTGKVVKSVAQVVAGDRLEVRVSDGQFESTVEQT